MQPEANDGRRPIIHELSSSSVESVSQRPRHRKQQQKVYLHVYLQGAQASMVKSVAAGGEQPSSPLTDALGNLLDQDVSATDVSATGLPVVRTARVQPTGTTHLETPAEPVGPPAGASRFAGVRPPPPATNYSGERLKFRAHDTTILKLLNGSQSSILVLWILRAGGSLTGRKAPCPQYECVARCAHVPAHAAHMPWCCLLSCNCFACASPVFLC